MGPKVLKGTKVPDTLADVRRVVMVGFDNPGSIKLRDNVSM